MEKISNTTKQNKIEQERNTKNGLTPIQEQTAILLASGESLSEVAEKLSVARSTIYQWQTQITFKCFYNKQCEDIRNYLENALMAFYQDAISAIRDSLKSSNESVRLNAAKWLIMNIENMRIGETNAKKAFKAECTGIQWDADNIFDESKYKKLLSDNGIDDD